MESERRKTFLEKNSLYELKPDLSYLENILVVLFIIEMIQGGGKKIWQTYCESNDLRIFIGYAILGIVCIFVPSYCAREIIPLMHKVFKVKNEYRKLVEGYIVTVLYLLSFYFLYFSLFHYFGSTANLIQFLVHPINSSVIFFQYIANKNFICTMFPKYLATRWIHFTIAFIYVHLLIIGDEYIFDFKERKEASDN
jgi:hypothetical protein